MSCGLAEDIEIEFEHSGVRIQPYEVNTRGDTGEYDYSKSKISREAGEVIAENAVTGEPVNILIGGYRQGRYVLPQNSLSLGTDETTLELYDAEKILTSGVISKTFHKATIEEIVEYIFSRVEDPYGVLTGWELVNDAGLPAYAQSVKNGITGWLLGDPYTGEEDGFLGTILDIEATLLSVLDFLPLIDFDDYEIKLDEATPQEALQALDDTFGLHHWVDDQGVLWVGIPALKPTDDITISADDPNPDFRLADYNVQIGDTPVKTVAVRGKTRWYPDRNSGNPSNDGAHLYPQAVATTSHDRGLVNANAEPLNLQSLAAVEYAAQMRFVRLWTEYESGTLVINGLASTNQEDLVKLTTGSLVAVSPGVGRKCGHDVDGGLFVVTRIQHHLSKRRGWQVTLSVSGFPDDLTITSNLVDPQKQETYPDYETFVEQT